MKFCEFLLLLCATGLCLGTNPGIRVKMTQKGLDYGTQFGVKLLKQRLKNAIFDDMSGQDTSGFTGLNYTIAKIRVNDVEFPNTSVSLIPGTGIKLSVNEASAIVSAEWRAKTWISSRSSGRLMVFISGVSIVAVASASQDETGRPMLLLESCQGKVHEVNIQLDETASWSYRMLSSFLKRPLRNSLSSNLCPSIDSEIQRLNNELKQHQTQNQIDEFAVIDYSLAKAPAVFSSSITLDLKGTVYPVGKVTEPPIKPAPFTLPETMDCMFYIGVSEYFFQSASLAYFTCGAFNASTADELSSYFKVTTDTLGSILPTVADRYAEPLPVMMNIVATAAPVIHLHNASFRLELAASVEMLAVLPNSTTQSMFTLNITARTHASLTIFEKNLVPALCLHSFQLSLVHSRVGFFKVSLLENFFSYILRSGVIPAANAKLKEGFPLPLLDKMILVNPAVTVHQGYLLISTDVSYKSSDIERRQRDLLASPEDVIVIEA
ncbi:BPI fold-containing family C protein [Varanus komodoensis]|uniref:BPI fold-containing family C protein n=1 Tax=Varanus komodoensis TaxID=61221 RepID=UPI001CF79396|nr:BPI fold-containing family C protein [Varanus komodoensis]